VYRPLRSPRRRTTGIIAVTTTAITPKITRNGTSAAFKPRISVHAIRGFRVFK